MKEDAHRHEENLRVAERVAYLISAHMSGKMTADERRELDDWITENDENLELFEKLTDEENIETGMQDYLRLEKEKAAALTMLKARIRRRRTNLLPMMIAAVLLLAVIGIWLFNVDEWLHKKPAAVAIQDRTPTAAHDKAVLTLSDGRTIILENGVAEKIADDGGATIQLSGQDELIYSGEATETRYNTVSTPRGAQFKLVLSDGTRVWLNAESSIRYAVNMKNGERDVEMRGEVYFEVAQLNTGTGKMPFRVKVLTESGEAGTIQVLGTHFNINAYADDGSVKATLIEGSVKASTISGKTALLQPGEECMINSGALSVKKAGYIGSVSAWRQGKFVFHDATVKDIGEQIKRWYNVDVEYKSISKQLFNTEATRDLPLPQLLDALEGTGQGRFTLQGKTLIIK